jgi:hypothetical protein
LSRTSAENTDLFELKIWVPGQGAMRDLIRAENLKQAITFAENRYPNCLVEVPATSVKPKLIRSSAGRKGVEKKKRRAQRKSANTPDADS